MNHVENKKTSELIYTLYKIDWRGSPEEQDFRHTLANAITGRMIVMLDDMPRYRDFQRVMKDLKLLLTHYWGTQELVMLLPLPHECSVDQQYILACAARDLVEGRIERDQLMKRLDTLIGE